MNLSEKAAYLDGLSDGLGLKKDGKMGSFWTALNGLLGDMAHQIEELKTSHDELGDLVDDLSDELDALEEYGFDMEPIDEEDDWEDEDGDEDEDDTDDDDVIRFNSRDGILKPGQKPSPYDDEEMHDFYEEEEEPEGDKDDPSQLLPLDKLSYNGVLYDVICPSCGEEITLDEELLRQGSTVCPICGELLEFDMSEDSGEDDAEDDETEADEDEPLEPIVPRLDPDKD